MRVRRALAAVPLLAATLLPAGEEVSGAAPAPEADPAVEAGEPLPTRWRHFGRVFQVDRAERLVLILSDPPPLELPAECLSRNGELRPTARLSLLPVRRSGVFVALARDGLPQPGEEVVFDVTP